MKSFRFLGAVAALTFVGAAAQADTVATFADPAMNATTPLFSLSGNTLTGGWAGTGLTLLTPGTPAPDFSDVTFVMTPLTVTPVIPGLGFTNGGNVRFFDSMSIEIFRIDFTGGVLTDGLSFGSRDFMSTDVTFSGAVLGGLIATGEQFAFSFANLVPTQTGYDVTSAFTSSATLRVPAPTSLAGLGVAALLGGRRRRRA